MLSARDYPPGSKIYTFVCEDGTNIHIDSIKLRAWCLVMKPEILLAPIDRKMAREWLRDNVVDMARVLELATTSGRIEPIIFGLTNRTSLGDHEHMLIDGHHRYALAAFASIPFIECHILTVEQWTPFQIEGLRDLTKDQLIDAPVAHFTSTSNLK